MYIILSTNKEDTKMSKKMSLTEIRYEFARRKVQFHANENADSISCWGLFNWGDVSRFIKSGKVIPNSGYTKENKVIWCRPSENEWKHHIEPLTKKYTLKELSSFAGW
jgi:hypothetical protein